MMGIVPTVSNERMAVPLFLPMNIRELEHGECILLFSLISRLSGEGAPPGDLGRVGELQRILQ